MSFIQRLLIIAITAVICLFIHYNSLPLYHPLQPNSPVPASDCIPTAITKLPETTTNIPETTTNIPETTTKLTETTPITRKWQHTWNISELELSSSSNDTEYQLQDCLRERWIYIIGDSTGRIFMQAMLLVLYHQFPDGFERYLLYNGQTLPRGTATEDFTTPIICKQHLNTGCGCIREFFDRKNGMRVTFVWAVTAGEGSLYLDSLIGHGNVPDLFVTSVGAWDILNNVPPQIGAERAVNWILGLTATYPSALVVAMTPNACVRIHSMIAQWIAYFCERLLIDINQLEKKTLVLFDKEPSTRTMDMEKCDGYHVMLDELNVQQVLSVLLQICK